MTREEFLKERILNQYQSIRSFSEFIKMPYSTLTSILKNVGGASITNLKKICDGLDITLDDLAYFDTRMLKQKSYYTDPAAAEYAEELRTNPEMKMLFSAARNISKESMKKTYEYIKFLKTQEKGTDD